MWWHKIRPYVKRYIAYLLVVVVVLGTLQIPAVQAFIGRTVGGSLQGSAGRVNRQIASANGAAPTVYYPFDGDANNAILSARNDLSVGTVSQVTGKIGHAASFASSFDPGLSSTSSDFTMTNSSFTIGAWVYLTSLPNESVIASKYTADAGPREYLLHYVGSAVNRFEFYVLDNANNAVAVTSTVPISSGQWYYVASWYDNENKVIGISVNDTVTTVTTSPFTWPTVTSSAFRIGSRNSTAQIGHAGYIDEAGIWRRALTSAERTSLYNSGNGTAYSNFSNGLKKNLVSYYALEEASGSRIDAHPHASYTSTINGDTALTTGKYGQAYTFDGNGDYINTTYPGVSGSGARSLSVWTYHASGGGGYIAGYGTNTTRSRVDFQILGNDVWLRTSSDTVQWVNAILPDRWNHLIYTYTAGSSTGGFKLYVNGVEKTSPNVAGTFPITTGTNTPLRIGANQNGDSWFNGKIDEFRFYDRTLTAAEVQQLYGGSSPLNCDQTCMGWWKLDESSGASVVDYSGQGNTGTTSGSPTQNIEGIFKGAYGFSSGSSQYVTVNDASSLDLTTAATVSFWFKRSSGQHVHVGKYNGLGNYSYLLQVFGSDNKIYFVVSGDGSNAVYFVSNGAFTDAGWSLLTGTYNGSTLKVYLNGVEIAGSTSGAVPASLYNSSSPVDIGRYTAGSPTTTYYATGSMDDVRIYNRALNPTEIYEQYLSGKPIW